VKIRITVLIFTTSLLLCLQAFSQGDLHVKGKIKSDSIANSGALLIYADSSGTLDTLDAGQPGQVLYSNGAGGKPTWSSRSGCDSVLYTNLTSIGTDANNQEKVLGSYVLPGSTLNNDGDWIEIEAFGTVTTTTTNTSVRLKFGGDIILQGVFTNGSPNNLQFVLHSKIYRVNGNFQKSTQSSYYPAFVGLGYLQTHTKNLSNDVVIVLTGQNGTGSTTANNILLEGIIVRLIR